MEGDCSMLDALKVEYAGVAEEMNKFQSEFIVELLQAMQRLKESGQYEYYQEYAAKLFNQ